MALAQAAHLPLKISIGQLCWRQACPSRAALPVCSMRRSHGLAAMASAGTGLAEKRCIPCEQDGGGLGFMGLCENLSKAQAEEMLPQVGTWLTLAQILVASTACDSILQPPLA